MDEFEIIRRYFDRPASDDSIVVGVGDDGAIMRPMPGHDLISVVDTMVSGVHFTESLSPSDVGYRAVAVNVSDIAAMGGNPRWMTMALTLFEANSNWLEDFAGGVFDASREYGVALVGGDITHGSELVISVQINGEVEPGKSLRRSGAKAGDGIYVTGSVGDAAAGLSLLQSGAPADDCTAYLLRRFARPEARVDAGLAIALSANSAIDISDGLYTDLDKLLGASNLSATIEIADLPLSVELQDLLAIDDARIFGLSGGDDYELCFTGPPDRFDASDEIEGTRITRIGSVGEGAGIACTLHGTPFDYTDKGYRHFK
jgi:thiamine-monophosphate kinase